MKRLTEWMVAVVMVAAFVMACGGVPAHAESTEKPLEIKIVTLAPSGTVPHFALLKMGEKWAKLSGGKVRLTVVAGYRSGGEAAIVDKMNVRGLDGALMTTSGLGRISKSVAALNSIPLVFQSLAEADFVQDRFGPEIARSMEQKGYVSLFWTDVGWTRFFSVDPLIHPNDLKHMKVFVWSGSPEQVELMKGWGTTPVSLEPESILSSLSTGMISAIPSPPFAANAAQYARSAKHMLEINWAPFVGGLVIRKQIWDKVPGELRAQFLRAAAEAGREIKLAGRKENEEAVHVMKKRLGLQVHPVSPAIDEEWRQAVKVIYPRIRGAVVPAASFDRVEDLLREYRARRQS